MRIDKPAEWFDEVLPRTMTDHPERVGDFRGTLVFNITGDEGGTWSVHIEEGQAEVCPGEDETAAFRVKMRDKNFVRMMNGDITGPNAFMSGKLKFRGDVTQAMKLRGLLFAG